MIKRFYRWLYNITSKPEDRGQRYGGYVQGMVRSKTLELCGALSGKALEIGAGSGLFLLRLAAHNPSLEIWGIDSDAYTLAQTEEKAREKGLANIHLSRQNATGLTFTDESFDTVVCINFFINIDIGTAAKVLKEMKRVCKRGGRILLEYRNSRNLPFRLKYRFAKYYDPCAPYPLYTYYPKDMDRVIDEAGLEAVRKEYIGFPIKGFAPIIMVEARKR